MYIKQVIIEGFKSYKEQVATEDISPKVNCVVGANGSGKSNFFHAICFVISDLFHNLHYEDKHSMFHELGEGNQVPTAFVEIVFDNSDNRMLVDKEEVRLRRTIDIQKDQYFLDGKHITKTEVMNLLESAGFSCSNPYYVVQQGKVASLSLMNHSQLLDLLKEISGTRVYEERRRHCLNIMHETENKRNQIIQISRYLDEELTELDEKKPELKKYEQLCQKRKVCLEEYEKICQNDDKTAFEMNKQKSKKELYNMLHECNEQLKQFSHVNKKTLDQYVNFSDQRKQLQKRQQQLDAGDEKIKELLSVLDQRSVESLEKTFKGVAKHFQDVFSELVKGGHGFLVMMKKKDGSEGSFGKYIGVKLEVSFNGEEETQIMKQLTAGQKTVTALALIFAIQRFDPALIYLFDEIEAELDPQYRTAVGNMVHRLADMGSTQFITTTIHPEIVKVADKIYGVTNIDRVSCVNSVTMDEALDFIEHDQSHNSD